MRILGDLGSLGVFSSVAWASRHIVRDVLDYRWKRELLKHTPKSQVPELVRELNAPRRSTRS